MKDTKRKLILVSIEILLQNLNNIQSLFPCKYTSSIISYFYYTDSEADCHQYKMSKEELKEYNQEQLKLIREVQKETGLSENEAVAYYVENYSRTFRRAWHLKNFLKDFFWLPF